jgi:hypothetical protein
MLICNYLNSQLEIVYWGMEKQFLSNSPPIQAYVDKF